MNYEFSVVASFKDYAIPLVFFTKIYDLCFQLYVITMLTERERKSWGCIQEDSFSKQEWTKDETILIY